MDRSYWEFGGTGRFDFPSNIVRVTGGRGSECLLIFGSEKTALYETGIAYSQDKLINNIHAALLDRGRTKLDYILLSHSHYDHVGGMPYISREWPQAQVIAAEKTKKVFASAGARATMERLSKIAVDYFGKEGDAYKLDGLRVDRVVRDGDRIDLGDSYFYVLETKGHTDDCLTFVLEPQSIMFTSESTGVLRITGTLSPEIVKSYNGAIASAQKCIAYGPKQLMIPHYGILAPEDTISYFAEFLKNAIEIKNFVLECWDSGMDYEECLNAYEKKYWIETMTGEQSKSAFRENARPCVYGILKEFGRITDDKSLQKKAAEKERNKEK
ncbi:MAG: MBL fold metallo-hydrolase [Eubacteriales bacterium]|nr:MBL fold metallo-hydrolase [Eubacteriales bacterium]